MSDDIVHRMMPRMRKVTLALVLSMAFTNSVLLVVTLVRPVPQFSSSGCLMDIKALNDHILAKRGALDDSGGFHRPYHQLQEALHEPPHNVSRDRISYNRVPARFKAGNSPRSPCGDECGSDDEDEDPPKEKPEPTSTYYITRAPKGSATTTLKTSVKHIVQTVDAAVTRTKSKESKPTKEAAKGPKVITRGPNDFVDLWIGPLGVCLQRWDGTLACSPASLTPNYLAVYNQSGLNEQIKSRLPHSPGAAPVFLLLGAFAYTMCALIFAYTLSPPWSFSTAYGPMRSMDSRHQTALAINATLSVIAMFMVLISTFTMRGSFLRTVKAIPAWNTHLVAQLGEAFKQLYAACILGGFITITNLTLVSEDLRYPWWFLFNNFRRNPFQVNSKPLNFTPSGMEEAEKEQAEREAEAQQRAAEERDRQYRQYPGQMSTQGGSRYTVPPAAMGHPAQSMFATSTHMVPRTGDYAIPPGAMAQGDPRLGQSYAMGGERPGSNYVGPGVISGDIGMAPQTGTMPAYY